MKVYILTALFIAVLSTSLSSAKFCSCGDFNSGHTAYLVDGAGFCTSAASKQNLGMVRTYLSNEGMWEIDEVAFVSSQEAQDRCCQAG